MQLSRDAAWSAGGPIDICSVFWLTLPKKGATCGSYESRSIICFGIAKGSCPDLSRHVRGQCHAVSLQVRVWVWTTALDPNTNVAGAAIARCRANRVQRIFLFKLRLAKLTAPNTLFVLLFHEGAWHHHRRLGEEWRKICFRCH